MVGKGRSVMLVEDDPLTRGLLAETLTHAGFIVGAVAHGTAASRMLRIMDPDAVILDIDLGRGVSGFDIADAIVAQAPGTAILFLTNLPDSRFAGRSAESLPEGAGYLRKDLLTDPKNLIESLDAVLRGKTERTPRDDRDPSRPLARLSATQIEILRMVSLGMSNQQIADERGTTTKAVHNVICRALAAIGIDNAEEGSSRVRAAREFMQAAGIPQT
jgi:DNA-binding NarL/FixJ family response regulator